MSGDSGDSFSVPAINQGVTRDLLEARKVVEVEVARLAGQRRTDAEIAELEAILRAH